MCQERCDNMEVYKTYKFRMYPDLKQQMTLNSFLGASRFVYNHYLNKKEENPSLTFLDMKKDLPNLVREYPWLKDIDGSILRTAIDNLENAFKKYESGLVNKPKYKSYNAKRGYKTICLGGITSSGRKYQNISIDLEKRTIKLPKISEIGIRGYHNLKEFNSKIINVTVEKVAGKYYAFVLVSEDIEIPRFIPNYMIGVDLGVKDLVVCSDGYKFESLKDKLLKYEHKLKGLNKWLSRSEKGSKNRKKIILKIQKVNEKIKNTRKCYNHLITNKLIKENDIIVLETLKVKKMIENGKNHLAKYISNSNFAELIRTLKYKALWHNKRIYQVNTYYPSSQLCSHCKERYQGVKDLSVREWECPSCHSLNDRDINASINILDEGMKLYLKDLGSGLCNI